MVLVKKQLSMKILAIAVAVATAVAFMPMFGSFSFAAEPADTYNVTSPANNAVEVEYTGQVPDLSTVAALDEITVANVADPSKTATLTRGVEYTVEAQGVGPGSVQVTFTTMGAYAEKAINPLQIKVVEAVAPDTYSAKLDASALVYNGTHNNMVNNIRSRLGTNEGLIILKNGNTKVRYGNQAGRYSLDVVPDPSNTTQNGTAGEKYKIAATINGGAAEPVYEDTVEITKYDLSNAASVRTAITDPTYTGAALTPDLGELTVRVPNGYQTTVLGRLAPADYTVTGYADNTNAGTAKATIEAKAEAANFTGTATVSFTIAPVTVNNPFIDVTPVSYVFNGAVQKPSAEDIGLKAYFENTKLSPEIPAGDYKIKYETPESTAAGTYQISIEASDSGNVVIASATPVDAYAITKADMANVVVTQIVDDIVAGTVINAENFATYFTAMLGEVALTAGTDFDVAYTTGKNSQTPGATDELTLTGKGNYEGTAKKEYTVGSKAFAEVYTSTWSATYDGSAKVPNATALGALTEKGGTATLTTADYEVTGNYQNNVNAGTATAAIKGKGDYAGRTAVVEFTITPQTVDPATATVTGVSSGTYYKGAVISGATVKFGSSITLGADEAVVTAETFATLENKLTEVKVTLNEGGNYTCTPFVFTLNPPVVANIADLSQATITGTIPAGLTAINEAVIKENITGG